ncbi:MAG: acyl carrier protein [Dehalococcoidia bacterium]|nr:acyl carrier protein [Dehalococcoidia bacterium]
MATVLDRVRSVVTDKLGVEADDVTLEASFVDDLNADSLDLVELIMAFEEEFSDDANTVEISDEEAEKITTVEEAVEFLRSKGVSD